MREPTTLDSEDRSLTRRQALGGLASVGVLSVAGCSGLPSFGGVSPLWRYDLEAASGAGPPAATGGTVFVGGQDKRLHAISEDGSHGSSMETGGPIESEPAIPAAGGRRPTVHVHSTDGDLYCMSTASERLWHREGLNASGRAFRAGSLVVELGYDDGHTAIGYDAGTGYRRFEIPVRADRLRGLTRKLFAVTTPAAGEWTQLTVFEHDGSVRWQTEPSRSYPDPVAGEGQIIGAQRHSVTAYNSTTGDVRWTADISQVDNTQLLRLGPALYLKRRPRDGTERLLALDPDSGTKRWRLTAGYEIRAVAPIEDAVFVASTQEDPDGGVLGRVDRFTNDGTREWKTVTDAPRFEGLVAVGSIVLAVSDRELVALDPASGEVRWRHESESGSRLAPAVDRDRLYVSYRDEGAIARFPTEL